MPLAPANAFRYSVGQIATIAIGPCSMFRLTRHLPCALLLLLLAAFMPMGATPSGTADIDRVLVYFDEFSANLSPETQRTSPSQRRGRAPPRRAASGSKGGPARPARSRPISGSPKRAPRWS